MKKTLKNIYWGFLCLFFLLSCHQQKEAYPSRLPDYPISKGVSAPFAGFIGDWLVVAGGCNFPDVPAAEGGKKVYYREVYALNTADTASRWVHVADLPFPVAYGAMAETEQGLVCMGGMNSDSVMTAVYRIEKIAEKDSFAIRCLPSLPAPIDNGAAAHSQGRIYLTGGNQNDRGRRLYALTVGSGEGEGWKQLADYPGNMRVQPVLLAQDSTLYLCGGFEALRPDSCVLSVDMLRYDVARNEWKQGSDFPNTSSGEQRCLVGGSGVATSKYLILAGGVNYRIFKEALEGRAPEDYMKKSPEWYRFNRDILVYSSEQGTWQVLDGTEAAARAGGVLLQKDGLLYMVCGEIKPGVRSTEVNVIPGGNELLIR